MDAAWEHKLIIAGVEYGMERIASLRTSNSLLSGPEIGRANAGQIDFQIYPNGTIPRGAKIQVFSRLASGGTAAQWIPMGVYYFSTRETDVLTGWMTVHGFDPMFRTEGSFLDGQFESYGWPMPAAQAASLIALRVGTDIDSRSEINPDYEIPCPIQVDDKGNESGNFPTSREILQRIAVASGGNWTVTADGKLRLVGLADRDKTIDIEERLNRFNPGPDYPAITGVSLDRTGNSTDDSADQGMTVYVAASGNRYHSTPSCGVGGYSATTLGEALERGLTPCQNCGGASYMAGNDSGLVLECASDDGTQSMADFILSRVGAFVYRPFAGYEALLDPAAELGDTVRICGGDYMLASIDRTFDLAAACDISCPSSGDEEDEYPYIPKSDRDLRKVKDIIEDIVDSALDDLDNRDDDLQDQIDGLDTRVSALENGGLSCEHPQTDELDFTGWDDGGFQETLDTGKVVDYDVDFDFSGRPVSITQNDTGHEMRVVW